MNRLYSVSYLYNKTKISKSNYNKLVLIAKKKVTTYKNILSYFIKLKSKNNNRMRKNRHFIKLKRKVNNRMRKNRHGALNKILERKVVL